VRELVAKALGTFVGGIPNATGDGFTWQGCEFRGASPPDSERPYWTCHNHRCRAFGYGPTAEAAFVGASASSPALATALWPPGGGAWGGG